VGGEGPGAPTRAQGLHSRGASIFSRSYNRGQMSKKCSNKSVHSLCNQRGAEGHLKYRINFQFHFSKNKKFFFFFLLKKNANTILPYRKAFYK
jgi:hypothetical protein